MTGVSGHMGAEVLKQCMELADAELIRVLLSARKRNNKLVKRLKKKYGARLEVVRGSVSNRIACAELVRGADYVVHMAAVIPPRSDADPEASYECNTSGAVALIDAVKAASPQPSYIHISTVALYGNRNEKHPYGRVGDPLLVSPFDCYAMHKLRGERYCLDAGLDRFVVLRQTAMLYPDMMRANVSDGLMFHTALNAPLEWATARDSGYLIRRILERDVRGEIGGFWNNIYNIGAGERGRETGYDTFNDGFAIIGGSAEKFFKPHWLATRNFHGVWFYDADELEELFHYQRDGVHEYWKEIGRAHKVYALGKLVPKGLIHFFLFRRLLKHPNSPRRWVGDGDEARCAAAFGSLGAARELSHDWKDYKLIAKGDFGDYEAMRSASWAKREGRLLSHGFDDEKPMAEWTIGDAKAAAAFRGGECLSDRFAGDVYGKIEWRCADGHDFEASPFTVMRGGHWCPMCCQPTPWDFDRLSRRNPYFAQVWYDSHSPEELVRYDAEEGGGARMTPVREEV